MLEGQLSQLSTEVERLFEEARSRARRELADQLNQAVRRIRQAESLDELSATLLDATAPFSSGAAILRIDGENAAGERVRGVAAEKEDSFHLLEIPLEFAPALAGALQTRDPVIAVTAPSEVSPQMVSMASHPSDGRAYIFPVVIGKRVPAILYCWGQVQGPALEMLAQVASATWDDLLQPEPSPLVTIAPSVSPAPAVETPAAVVDKASSWDDLSQEEQATHLRAQRFARVQVAEMRLRNGAAVQSGRAERNLYDALRARIDETRVTFREKFFAPCSSMVDYLHLELVRTLAHDDADLLGKDYPGPLV